MKLLSTRGKNSQSAALACLSFTRIYIYMRVCVWEWVSEWVSGWVSEWVSEWVWEREREREKERKKEIEIEGGWQWRQRPLVNTPVAQLTFSLSLNGNMPSFVRNWMRSNSHGRGSAAAVGKKGRLVRSYVPSLLQVQSSALVRFELNSKRNLFLYLCAMDRQ